MISSSVFLVATVLGADPSQAIFSFVPIFGPEQNAAPHFRPLVLGSQPPRPLAGAPEPGPGSVRSA